MFILDDNHSYCKHDADNKGVITTFKVIGRIVIGSSINNSTKYTGLSTTNKSLHGKYIEEKEDKNGPYYIIYNEFSVVKNMNDIEIKGIREIAKIRCRDIILEYKYIDVIK